MRLVLTLMIMFSIISCNKTKSQIKKVVEIPLFDEIQLNPTRDYEITSKINDQQVRIDLNFDSDIIKSDKIFIGIKTILIDVNAFENKVRNELISDYKNDGVTKEYIDHHLSELNQYQQTDGEILLTKLELHRIGFYPESSNNYAIFDYTIGKDLTDYLVVVEINDSGEIVDIRMES